MPVQITIRGVPEEVRDEIAARPALQCQSMQEFLRCELVKSIFNIGLTGGRLLSSLSVSIPQVIHSSLWGPRPSKGFIRSSLFVPVGPTAGFGLMHPFSCTRGGRHVPVAVEDCRRDASAPLFPVAGAVQAGGDFSRAVRPHPMELLASGDPCEKA